MDKTEFKRCMQCGLGRCITFLSACENKEEYRDIILEGCLNNRSFDTQCEGTRAHYIYELLVLYQDDDYFLRPVLEKFSDFVSHNGYDGWEFTHLCDLILEFATHGNLAAKNALQEKYVRLYARLTEKNLSKRNEKQNEDEETEEEYDYDRDDFEYISVSLVHLAICARDAQKYEDKSGKLGEELSVFFAIAADMGALFLQSDRYNGFDFEMFYSDFEDTVGAKRLSKLLMKASANSPSLAAFYRYMKAEKKRTAQNFSLFSESEENITAEDVIADRSKARKFAYCNNEDEKKLLAKKIVEEEDPSVKADLLSAFHGDFPYIDELISYSRSEYEDLKYQANELLAETKNPRVREFALNYIAENRDRQDEQTDDLLSCAIRAVIYNYRKGDEAVLLPALEKIEITYDENQDWHGIMQEILDTFERGETLPKEFLLYIYERSLCSCCRSTAVLHLRENGWLSEEIKKECMFDCNDETREYIQFITTTEK